MMFKQATDPYKELEDRANYIYNNFLKIVTGARNIYVGGITGPNGQEPLGESAFLCKFFPDLMFIDDLRGGSQFVRDVIGTGDFAGNATKDDILINNAQSIPSYNHFSRQAASLGVPMFSTLEALSALHKAGASMNFAGLTAIYGPSFHNFTLRNLDTYRKLSGRFGDRLSNETFDNIIMYRLSGDPSYLDKTAVNHNLVD